VQRRIAPLIPSSGYCLGTCDPDTGLMNHSVGGGTSPRLVREILENFYAAEFLRTIAAMRRGRRITRSNDPALVELRESEGLGMALQVILTVDQALWGGWILMRERNDRAFDARDFALLSAIAPHLARGIKLGRLIEAARFQDSLQPPDPEPGRERPAVVIIDATGRVTLTSATAPAILDNIRDVGFGSDVLPIAVVGARTKLLGGLAADGAAAEPSVRLRARGRSGEWYWVRALLTEPDPAGECSTMVIIEPVHRHEMAPILTTLYGLTPREREVLWRAALGESTRRISDVLGISTYTVQDHLDNACEKVGVRGRRALIAKIFLDGYVDRIHGPRGGTLTPTRSSTAASTRCRSTPD
jgi:DNA-binding CsgD family transcriptional regulator